MTPHRAPVFRDLYPTRAFYQEARNGFEEMLAPPVGATTRIDRDKVLALKLLPHELFPRGAAFDRSTAQIVPEAAGAITGILLTVPKFLDERNRALKFRYERYPRHFASLLNVFGADVAWVIVSGARERPFVNRWLVDAGVRPERVVHVESRFNYSIWAQDPFLVLRSSSHVALCEGILFNREEDMTVADDVHAQVEGIVAAQSHLHFQGGNLLGGIERTLIGADYVWRNTRRFGIQSEAHALELFAALVGTEVLRLGGLKSGNDGWHRDGIFTGYGFQPIFHIDMYVTPTGVRNDCNREIVFLSRPRAAHRAVGKWSEVPYLNDERIDAVFDETHAQLERFYEVRELPLLSTRGDLGGHEEFVRNYFLTWSNAMVESGVRRRVVLPSFVENAERFGLDRELRAELQRVVQDAWSALCFDVATVSGMEDLAWGDGSIHCMAKVLARDLSAPVPSVTVDDSQVDCGR